jgi:hypothetical protein
MLWEVDQRIAFGHVKAPWATATARPAAYARKRAEQILAQGLRVLKPGDPVASLPTCGCSCHTEPGVMHVAACCPAGLTAQTDGGQ